MHFNTETLELLAETNEVVIETRSGGRAYPTIIWIVVADDQVFVRSYLGDRGKWYRRALAEPAVVIVAGDVRVEATVVSASDPESVRRCSEALSKKYRPGRSLDAMLVPEVLPTTLRLDPA